MSKTARLKSLSDVRRFFYRNETPIYFVSATNFNLLGIDEWVRNFRFINYIDCFDGGHPNVFCPTEMPHEPFQSIEEINNYLLSHPEVVRYVRGRGAGQAVFLMFDDKTEALCKTLDLKVSFPSAALRSEVDDKIESTRIGNAAGVASVPNVLTRVTSYADLREKTRQLGDALVVQTAFGDSGHTTFFIESEQDFDKHADEIIGDFEIKAMKRVRCRGSAIEACVTRHGTIVGPLMTELVGFSELTPYRGGWCGNEVFAEAFSRETRAAAREKTFKVGEQLRERGYRGYFEIDYLLDLDGGELYMGEINPRVTGASSMTNLAAFAHADAPLFLFHLLEFSEVDFDLDVAEINQRWSEPQNIDSWSQMVIKHTSDDVGVITGAPPSGIWQLDDAAATFVRSQTHRRTVQSDNRGFFLRIGRVGDYLYEGADLGILVTPGRLMTDEFELTDRARRWVSALGAHYSSRPVIRPVAEAVEAAGFKFL